ncbi:hypothetical protein RJ55_03176 [Drechmeria coniospora]|nr:hypothetical protein RJ55_03176 [Drechmeria coniospora]
MQMLIHPSEIKDAGSFYRPVSPARRSLAYCLMLPWCRPMMTGCLESAVGIAHCLVHSASLCLHGADPVTYLRGPRFFVTRFPSCEQVDQPDRSPEAFSALRR